MTGASAGLGVQTTRELARAGARVVMAVRDEAKGRAVAEGFGPTRGAIEVRRLDVSSLDSVETFADAWSGPLDLLVNNAGITLVPLARTADGLELQMATNSFGAVALTSALLPAITDRVVSLSSQLHRISRLRVDDLGWRSRDYDEVAAYCDSKLAVVLFSDELQRRLTARTSRIRSIAAHPGIARTSLASHSRSIYGRINMLGPLLNDVEHGALTTLYASTMDVPGGTYVGPDGPASIKGHPTVRKPSRTARDPAIAASLWSTTADVLGQRFRFDAL